MQTVQNCQGFHTLWFFDSSEPWASQLLGSTFGWKLWSKECLWRTFGATEVDFGGDGGKPDLWMLNPLTTWHPMNLCCIFHFGSQLDMDSFQHNRLCWICFYLKTTNDSVASLHHFAGVWRKWPDNSWMWNPVEVDTWMQWIWVSPAPILFPGKEWNRGRKLLMFFLWEKKMHCAYFIM